MLGCDKGQQKEITATPYRFLRCYFLLHRVTTWNVRVVLLAVPVFQLEVVKVAARNWRTGSDI